MRNAANKIEWPESIPMPSWEEFFKGKMRSHKNDKCCLLGWLHNSFNEKGIVPIFSIVEGLTKAGCIFAQTICKIFNEKYKPDMCAPALVSEESSPGQLVFINDGVLTEEQCANLWKEAAAAHGYTEIYDAT